MAAQSALSQTQEERLQEILAAYLRDVEAGRNPDRSEILARHPDLAGELQDFFAGQEQLGRLAAPLRQAIEPDAGAGITGTLGDFRIVREVGRGGMGIVYEAEQISLRRRVALKVLPFAATMDPRHLQRFHNEAQAAACLHHTNIVPVHFVGSERGVHFYAMQFIDGQPLSDLIRQMRRMEQQTPAAGEVHTVVYQPAADEAASTPLPAAELTPLTGEGRRSRDYYRKVAELGVQAAEALDHAHQLGIVHRDIKPANLLLDGRGNLWVTDFGLAHMQHGEASLTGTGQMVGTPRYMSPEQALAKRVPIDHRTDVYSLGVTLYELLTLHPAFASEDRQELLRQIAFEEPAAPRRLHKTIPAELEIIVLKAMEKRPQDRYATAQELAGDLERWLRHEPIRARRPTLLQRAAKWVRRHKSAAAASAVVLLMALMLTGYIAWMRHDRVVRQAASSEAIRAALKESKERQEERRMPEALSAARRAAGLLPGVEGDEALKQQVLSRRDDLELLDRLENARLEDFSRDTNDERYGEIFRAANLERGALPGEEAGERLRRTTVAAELAAVLDDWASARREFGGAADPGWKRLLQIARVADPDPVRTRVREAMESRNGQALQDLAASEEIFRSPAATLVSLGTALLGDKRTLRQSEAFLRTALRRYPNDLWLNYNLLRFFMTVQPHQSEEAVRFAAVIVALRPENSCVHGNFGMALAQSGRIDEAIAEYRESLRIQSDDAQAHTNLGLALGQKGRSDEAIAEHREAIRFDKGYAPAHNNLGVALREKGQVNEAIAAFREAIRVNNEYGLAHKNLGDTLRVLGQLNEAIAEHREAIRINENDAQAHNALGRDLVDAGQLDAAIAEHRKAISLNKDYAGAHQWLGLALLKKGQVDEALAEYREALRLKNDAAVLHNEFGVALGEKGQLSESIAEYREAIRLDKNYALAHYNLANALRGKGLLDEAIVEFREAIRINKDLAEAHCNLGNALLPKGRFAEALEHVRRGHELGSKKPRWPWPSAQWVQNCERILELDGKRSSILSGKKQPSDNAERLNLAKVCQMSCKKRYAAALRFYGEAFAAEPKLAESLNAQHRYNAACAAVLAGCGQGADADKLDAKERARMRRQALDWLRADLRAYRQTIEKFADKAGRTIAQRMHHWLKDDDFAGVRGNAALAKLPAEERSAWRKLWADVAELLAQAQGKTPAEKNPDTKSPPRHHTGA